MTRRDLEKAVAVLEEKVKRLEIIVYTVIGFAILQLLGLFILWAINIINLKHG